MSTSCNRNLVKKFSGFSYVEVLIATVLIAITLVPALEALQGSMMGSEVHENISIQQYQLQSKLEEILAKSFDELESAAIVAGSHTVATSLSDAMGVANRRVVFLSKYDGDNADSDSNPFTGMDEDLLWVRVEIENTSYSYETLTNN